jgi:maleate cis-trans isomerase
MKKIPTIGFISAPAWFDPAPSEFSNVIVEEVRTQQAPLLLPEFDYRLESIASVQNELNLCARSLKAMGCDVVAQVGSPFAWAKATSEAEARLRNKAMMTAAHVPTLMTGLAIVDGLRALHVNKISVTCTYYEPDWRDGFSIFLRLCGFDITHASTLAEQGLIAPFTKMEDIGWSMTPELASKSILFAAEASPDAEAIVVTGAGTRTLDILADMEAQTKRPIIAADTILYWAIARELDLTLLPVMGSLSNLT